MSIPLICHNQGLQIGWLLLIEPQFEHTWVKFTTIQVENPKVLTLALS